jgi:dienelactone hydrolase
MTTLRPKATRRMRRFAEQRWLLDAVIETVGLQWDQGRIGYSEGPCGLLAQPDFERVRSRVKKFDDIAREFAAVGLARMRRAEAARQAGHDVSQREHSFIASILFSQAQWPIFENTEENNRLESLKNAAYAAYASVADHPVRQVELPWGERSLPGWLHLPPGASADRQVGCVISFGGMDSAKEMLVSLYGDPLLQRGIAVLALDGPGQASCTLREMWVRPGDFPIAAAAALDWLEREPEIDRSRIAVRGISMGSMWATQAAARNDRIKACAVVYLCQEQGGPAIFGQASPTFKNRFMYMAGYDDEDEFDAAAQDLVTVEGLGELIHCPYLAIGGEDDELTALEPTFALLDDISAPKELMLLQGERHTLDKDLASKSINELTYIADWFADCLAGRTPDSVLTLVGQDGRIRRTPWSDRPPYHHGLPEVVLGDDLPEVVQGE